MENPTPLDRIINAAITGEKSASVGMATYAAYEDRLDTAFDHFHDGKITVSQLRKFLLTQGYSKAMAKAEIRQQIQTANFKREMKGREHLPG